MQPMGRLSMHSKCLGFFLLSFGAVGGRVRFFLKCPLSTQKVVNHFFTCIDKGEG